MWAHAIGKKSQLINDIWHGPRKKKSGGTGGAHF